MAISQGHSDMNVNWVIAAGYDPGVGEDVSWMKDIGPVWGSWQTWRACGTDNVICHDANKAQELLKRAFQAVCNFYIPHDSFTMLNRPRGVQLYQGDYQDHVLGLEDIISLHLATPNSDIVLMVGFDLTKPEPMEDRYEAHRIRNRLGLIRHLMIDNPEVQWVLVDHPGEPDEAFAALPNVMRDRLENVRTLMGTLD